MILITNPVHGMVYVRIALHLVTSFMPKKFTSILCLLSSLLIPLALTGQSKDSFIWREHSKNIAFITMDSVHTSQTTVIEYPKFLVLIELPFMDFGADKSTDFKEDTETAERLITFLKKRYSKPVKYVLSSHWHLHSLSGITPFFKEGAKLVAAKSNWAYSVNSGLVGDKSVKYFSKNVVGITRDTTLLAKTDFPIDVVYLDSSYAYKPTNDFLFFYFPKSKTLHTACMCALTEVNLETRKGFTYSDRLTDLNRSINTRNLNVEHIIKLGRFEKSDTYLPPVFNYSYLQKFMQAGKPMHVAVKQFTDLKLTELLQKKDSLIQLAVQANTSPQIINQAVYNFLKIKDYERAVAMANLLILFKPNDPNYIDTLGEAYYAMGNTVLANYYNDLLLKINSSFEGGIKTWEHNKIKGSY